MRRSRIARILEAHPNINLLELAYDLSSAFSLSEELIPQVAVLSESLQSADEYSMLRALFDALNIQTLIIEDTDFGTPNHERSVQETKNQGLIRQILTTTQQRAPMKRPLPLVRDKMNFDPRSLIVIGSSTGGIEALTTLLSSFPERCPPTLIVQHTGGRFSTSLCRLLNQRCAADVREGRDGEKLSPGKVRVAPGNDCHMVIARDRTPKIQLRDAAPVAGHRPSVNELFSSVAWLGQTVTAAILTGMGNDGAIGLKAIQRAGGQTFAQNEKTSVVFGMPRAAIELGAANQVLGIEQMGPALLQACSKTKAFGGAA